MSAGGSRSRRAPSRARCPCFIEDGGAKTDSWCWAARIIRCCSIGLDVPAPWPGIRLYPAPAVARRIANVLAERGLAALAQNAAPASSNSHPAAHRPCHLGPQSYNFRSLPMWRLPTRKEYPPSPVIPGRKGAIWSDRTRYEIDWKSKRSRRGHGVVRANPGRNFEGLARARRVRHRAHRRDRARSEARCHRLSDERVRACRAGKRGLWIRA